MNAAAKDRYFNDQVMTAPPQKLHLMLLESAFRHGQTAQRHWDEGKDLDASDSLIRSQELIAELLTALKSEVAPELVSQVASIYLFIYRTLVSAHLQHEPEKLKEALSILKLECETWRELCRHLEDNPLETEKTSSPSSVPAPKSLAPRGEYDSPPARFNVEA